MFVSQLLSWKSNKYYIFWVLICSLSYRACEALSPCYIVTCDLSGCTIYFFSTLSHKGTIVGQTLLIGNCVSIFSTYFIGNISHFKKNRVIYFHKFAQVFMWNTRHFCRIWIKIEFSKQSLGKYSNIIFQENPSSAISFNRNISHFKKNLAIYFHKFAQVFMWNTRNFCRILIKIKFSQ